MGFLDSIFGSESEYPTTSVTEVNTQGPRTEEGQQLWNKFMSIYSNGGAFDASDQASKYANLQDQIYNTQGVNLSLPGMSGSLSILSPLLSQKLNAINSTMGYSYSPFLNAMSSLESARNRQIQPVTTSSGGSSGSTGLLGSLMNAVGLYAGLGGLKNLFGTTGTKTGSWT